MDTPPPTPPHRIDILDYGILRRDRCPATLIKLSVMLELDEITMVFASKPMIVGVVPQSNNGAVVGEEGWLIGVWWWVYVVDAGCSG